MRESQRFIYSLPEQVRTCLKATPADDIERDLRKSIVAACDLWYEARCRQLQLRSPMRPGDIVRKIKWKQTHGVRYEIVKLVPQGRFHMLLVKKIGLRKSQMMLSPLDVEVVLSARVS